MLIKCHQFQERIRVKLLCEHFSWLSSSTHKRDATGITKPRTLNRPATLPPFSASRKCRDACLEWGQWARFVSRPWVASIQRRGNDDAIADLLLQAVESTLFGVEDVETMTGNAGMDGKFSHGRQTLGNLMEEAKK